MTDYPLSFSRTVALSFSLLGASASAAVTPYPPPPGDAANDQYSVKVNGVEIPSVKTGMDVGYAHFAFDGKARVEIKASEPIKEFNLSPHRLGIQATAED